MSTNTAVQPVILCLEADRQQQEAMLGIVQELAQGYELRQPRNADDCMRMLDSLVQSGQEVAMILVAQSQGDTTGDKLLLRCYQRWPSALRLLMAGADDSVDDSLVAEAKVFRVLQRPMVEQEFRTAVKEAVRYYSQQLEIAEKSRVLTELHRASMSLTGEIHLDKLLHKLMRIVIDNADALNGYIVLERKDGSMYIAAEGHAGSYETKTQVQEVNDFGPVCPAIVDFARKTRENVILHDAINEGYFSNHPYIRKHLCRSILCTPLVYQGKMFGILYLDNNGKINAFSPYSIDLFRLLSAPAAIAIQNALLYNDLEEKVAERTHEVIHQKEEIERQRDEIQEKNDDILGSIRYARRIQDAFLPKLSEIREVFPKSFVYYRPKDIVSGDFYWCTTRLSKVILAAADCTGHGIPGAFMTIMANTILRQIVELEGIFKPDEILLQLHLRIRAALQQDAESGNQDGLDIGICLIDPKRHKLVYAGANRPLLIVRRGEIMDFRGDKYGCGGEQLEMERHYTPHEISLEEGDTIYLFTDGYQDQIGEEINKRYMSRRFYQVLQDIQGKEMDHQRLLLDAELRHWRGDKEQTDDILVIGINI